MPYISKSNNCETFVLLFANVGHTHPYRIMRPIKANNRVSLLLPTPSECGSALVKSTRRRVRSTKLERQASDSRSVCSLPTIAEERFSRWGTGTDHTKAQCGLSPPRMPTRSNDVQFRDQSYNQESCRVCTRMDACFAHARVQNPIQRSIDCYTC